jgi:hypothetical protein
LKCEMLWKIWKKIVKRYGKYGRKLFNWLFFHIFHIISLFNLLFFHNFLILFNLPFFRIFHIIFTFQLGFLPYFSYFFTLNMEERQVEL